MLVPRLLFLSTRIILNILCSSYYYYNYYSPSTVNHCDRFLSNHFQRTTINKITSFCGEALIINLFLKPYIPMINSIVKALRKKVTEVVIKITIAVKYSSRFKKAQNYFLKAYWNHALLFQVKISFYALHYPRTIFLLYKCQLTVTSFEGNGPFFVSVTFHIHYWFSFKTPLEI